jgi:hypothetical protein
VDTIDPAARSALQAAGWLPEHSPPLEVVADEKGNLFPGILAAWQRHASAGRCCLPNTKPAAWLSFAADLPFQLRWLPAEAGDALIDHRLGPRLAWWPHGIPRGECVAVVSSRLGRRPDLRPAWLAALRQATANLDPRRDLLLTAAKMATHRFVERAAHCFQLRQVCLTVPSRGQTLVAWLRKIAFAMQPAARPDDYPVLISPPAVGSQSRSPSIPWSENLPFRDQVIVAAGWRIYVLFVRPGGHLHQLIRWRLTHAGAGRLQIFLAEGPGLTCSGVARELLALGAVPWTPDVPERSGGAGRGDAETAPPPVVDAAPANGAASVGQGVPALPAKASPVRVLARVPDEKWDYLTHWTRSPRGPWPDETEADYLDRLLLQAVPPDGSAFAALQRIVEQETIWATNGTIRGGARVVCFTELPLHELAGRRVYRRHRSRWDFERYGICIRRSWLETRAARPVLYGDADDWFHLSPPDRPFFQIRTTRATPGGRRIDWTEEREWRHPGHVDLRSLGIDDALLFVPSRDEACTLGKIARWNIVVVD